MITSLSIKNYALIEDIKVDFNRGLTIITGETGAGKSILLGALGLVLGNRADLKVMRDMASKCIIEAQFSIGNYALQDLFAENDLDYEEETIVRREILPSGKSRAFVNDTPVTLQQMQVLGEELIDIHSQHETRTLATEGYQMEVVDALAGNRDLLDVYRSNLRLFKEHKQQLSQLISERDQALKDLDYHSFLYNELVEANLASIQQEELEETYEKLNNAEEIQEVLAKVSQSLSNEMSGSITSLREALQELNRIRNFSTDYESLWNRVNSTIIELEDVESEVLKSADVLEVNPQLLMEVQEKMQTLFRLQQKHGVSEVSELLKIQEELEEKVVASSQIDETIETLETKVETARKKTLEIAQQINNKREAAIPILKEKLEAFLLGLGLPNAQFQFQLQEQEAFRTDGNAQLELLFTANKGGAFGLLQKVASGGEMSRIMLAIKAVLTEYKDLPTLIFDEIDTGVSGEIAHKMAEIMASMSKKMQVLSITHLPQIAAKGDYHKRVFKRDENNVTTTHIKELTQEDRIIEIAQMIGGSTLSDSAIAHAKQLLN
ncbi:DNA repair protein RecN [Aureisphaera galaxeae]|uniref:DNA repair protein RecN n=1 Tax=Aureisphaera galaxeae TaxID=1538023 RepID=UPI002350D7BF|nr:DNA repair protein RecN [Aureisphaera galaxeae]MDC8004968.1 DNA repair protein RecN [Aureisphaera galaxeae]